MIKYEGMKAEASKAGYPMLPEGPYVAVVKAVKIEGKAPDQTLIVRVDVSEGENAGYFTKRYENDKAGSGKFAPKYKGDVRMRIPNPNNPNAKYPETDVRRFNDMIWKFESSNDGFHWDGDETKLVGKTIGINMQAGEFNDKPYTTVGRFEVADDVRKGLVKLMKPKEPRYDESYQASKDTAAGFTQVEMEPDEIPF